MIGARAVVCAVRARACLLASLAAAAVLLVAAPGRPETAEPSPRPDQQFDVMNLLTQQGLHDLHDESWNAYGVFTFIGSYKAPFSARYTNLNGSPMSLVPTAETSWTSTLSLYFGARAWKGGNFYFVPEVVAEVPLSQLRGLGGAIQNFELQKTGSTTPQIYRSRLYLEQTFDLGGDKVVQDSQPSQLATVVDSRRLVVRAGNFSVIDFFDKNTFAGDLTQTFFNMDFLTYAAYDFVADARGFSWGGMAALYYDDWVVRFGRLAPPLVPNSEPVTFRLDQYYGDQAEIEHDYKLFGREGAVRLLGYHNRENMGRFDDAVAAFKGDPLTRNAAACPAGGSNPHSSNAHAPDLCWVRKPNDKLGIGLNLEQRLTDDIGVFFRGMYSDGQTEVYSFTSTDRSVSFGATAAGTLWRRARDIAGVGGGVGWISQAHAEYLRMGGIDGFIGDGALAAAAESVVEAFYSFNLTSSIWLSGDYQHITNPAYNAARGPVDIFGARVHAEF